jgi:hypothetical protein
LSRQFIGEIPGGWLIRWLVSHFRDHPVSRRTLRTQPQIHNIPRL